MKKTELTDKEKEMITIVRDEWLNHFYSLPEINKEKCDSTMVELLQEEIAGNAEEYYQYNEKISSVKLTDLKKLIKLKGYSFVALVPDN